jgi:hypothetical protein
MAIFVLKQVGLPMILGTPTIGVSEDCGQGGKRLFEAMRLQSQLTPSTSERFL